MEGIFRVPGSKKRQEELKELIDKDSHVKFSSGKFTPHDVACVLKQFLAELPEPLLTHAPHEAYIQVTGIPSTFSLFTLFTSIPSDYCFCLLTRLKIGQRQTMSGENCVQSCCLFFIPEIHNDQDNAKHIEALQLLFLMIPPENRTLLYYLLDLLNMISNNTDSKMTPHNLAVVFCPTILYNKKVI